MSTKKAATKKPVAISGGGYTAELVDDSLIDALLAARTSKQLAADLRSRSIPIPKTKDEMISRLASWLARDGGTFVINLH